MRKKYNTPHRSRVVKTRMTEEEYADFAERLAAYNMSQAEFIRQAITGDHTPHYNRFPRSMTSCLPLSGS